MAISFAQMIKSRCARRQIPEPTINRVVTAAAAVSETKSSRLCEYSGLSGSPSGKGVSRLAGMWV